MPEEIYKITFKLEPDDGPFDSSASPGPGGGGLSPGGAVAGGLGANLGVNLVKAIIGRGRGFGGGGAGSGAGVPAPRPPKLPPPLTQTLKSDGGTRAYSKPSPYLTKSPPPKPVDMHTNAGDDYYEWERKERAAHEWKKWLDKSRQINNPNSIPAPIWSPKEVIRDLEKVKG
jgi:hypothetical protein